MSIYYIGENFKPLINDNKILSKNNLYDIYKEIKNTYITEDYLKNNINNLSTETLLYNIEEDPVFNNLMITLRQDKSLINSYVEEVNWGEPVGHEVQTVEASYSINFYLNKYHIKIDLDLTCETVEFKKGRNIIDTTPLCTTPNIKGGLEILTPLLKKEITAEEEATLLYKFDEYINDLYKQAHDNLQKTGDLWETNCPREVE